MNGSKTRISQHCSINSLFCFPSGIKPQLCFLALVTLLFCVSAPFPLQAFITGKFQNGWQNGVFQCLYFILTLEKPVTKNHISSFKPYIAYWTVNVTLLGVPFPGVHTSTFLRFTEEMMTLVGLGKEAETKRNNNKAKHNY